MGCQTIWRIVKSRANSCYLSNYHCHLKFAGTITQVSMNLNITRYFDNFESSSDDDEEIIDYITTRRQKTFRPRPSQMEIWDDVDFVDRYRMSKESVFWIANEIKSVERPTSRNNAITPLEQVLLTLRFFATGNIQQCSGDLFGVHKSTACRVVHAVTKEICLKLKHFINMPQTAQDINNTVRKLYVISKFPNVVGAIDCTHVPILNPGGDNAELYRNRKDCFSFNVQVVADADLKIMDIVARWPGSTHDSTIFNASTIKERLQSGDFGSCCFLGDRGYALKSYLLTPLTNPTTAPQRLYNESQIRTRNVVERTFGVWKRRFPCIGSKLRVKLLNVQAIIVATAILHNICVRNRDLIPANGTEVVEEPSDIPSPTSHSSDHAFRNLLIQDYFGRLLNSTENQ